MESNCVICGKSGANWPLVESSQPLPDSRLAGAKTCIACRSLLIDARNGDASAQQALAQHNVLMDAAGHPDVASLIARLSDVDAAVLQDNQRQFSLSTMLTSSHNFEGYAITSYLGFISAETTIGAGMFAGSSASMTNLTGSESDRFTGKMRDAKNVVMGRLREAAYELGGNAIIGVDLEYTMFGGALLGVAVSGTAVSIERLTQSPLAPPPPPTRP